MGTTQLDTAPEPKYWHLKSVLLSALDSEFSVGEVLPNERELAARFGVARATLRQALEQLELEGRLQRRRGVGTTVAPPRIGVEVGPDTQGTPDEPGGWLVDEWRTESHEFTAAPASVARLLGERFADGAALHQVRRTRVTHGQPVAAELLYVPEGSVPAIPAPPQSTGPGTARAVLHALHQLELDGQERTVELGSARADDARQLDRLPGAPMLVVTTRYTTGGETAAVAVATYRADTCRLTFADGAPTLPAMAG